MLMNVQLVTYHNYLQLNLFKTADTLTDANTYTLIRYRLKPTSQAASAIHNKLYRLYMSRAYNMSTTYYFSTVDIEEESDEKVTFDVTNIVHNYDNIIDNTISDPARIYVYIIHAIDPNTNVEYVTDPVVGYVQLPIESFGNVSNPTMMPYFLKHMARAQLDEVNGFFYNTSNSIFYLNQYINQEQLHIKNTYNSIDTNTNKLLDKIEILIQTLKIYDDSPNVAAILKLLMNYVFQLQ